MARERLGVAARVARGVSLAGRACSDDPCGLTPAWQAAGPYAHNPGARPASRPKFQATAPPTPDDDRPAGFNGPSTEVTQRQCTAYTGLEWQDGVGGTSGAGRVGLRCTM